MLEAEKTILRDMLALERTKLANERTFLAFVRTSLYLLLGGYAFINLEGFKNTVVFGYISMCTSLVLITIGIAKFFIVRKRLKERKKQLKS